VVIINHRGREEETGKQRFYISGQIGVIKKKSSQSPKIKTPRQNCRRAGQL